MKYQSHGDHWSAIFNEEKDIRRCLEQIFKSGEFVYGIQTTFNNDGEEIDNARIFTIDQKEGPMGFRTLVYNGADEKNHFISSFPIGEPLGCCSSVTLKHNVDQWNNRIEANIEAETESEFSSNLNFYSADYLAYKHSIRLTEKAEYNLVAFALECRFPKEDEMELHLEGEKAINFLEKVQMKPKYNEKGEVEPVTIDLRKMSSFLPTAKDLPDIAQFRSQVSNVEAFTSFGVPMYRMMITIFKEDTDVNVTLYAKQEFFDHKPEEGEPILGVLWIQGFMKTNLKEELKQGENVSVETDVTQKFFSAIGKIDMKGYDDLMILLDSFDDLKIKPGYVIDGFWADTEDYSYTKLYFSAAGSEWRWQPEVIDGRIQPAFDDRMYIHNHVSEGFITNLPALTDYIKGPFTEKAIWEVYLLLTGRYYLPLKIKGGHTYRYIITRKYDFIRLNNERLGAYANDSRIESGVKILEDGKAIVSCAYWSEDDGLSVEKVVAIKDGDGFKFGSFRKIRII